jgi:hypothetical protein
MKVRNILIAAVSTGVICLFSAFGGEKMTLQEQMKKADDMVAENVETFTAKKAAECKAMAMQKAIGIAETKLAAMPKTPAKAVTTKKAAPVAPKKAPKVTPKAPPVKVDPATNVKEAQTTGRKIDPATNVKEVQTTGRRNN